MPRVHRYAFDAVIAAGSQFWFHLSADMTGRPHRRTGCGPVDLICTMVKAGVSATAYL